MKRHPASGAPPIPFCQHLPLRPSRPHLLQEGRADQQGPGGLVGNISALAPGIGLGQGRQGTHPG